LSEHLPQSKILAYDISSSSQEIYNNHVSKKFLNIEFVKNNFLDNLEAITSAEIFFTHNVLMNLTPEDLNTFFNYLSKSDKKIFGLIHELCTSENEAINYKGRDWLHNFFLNVEKNNLTMLDHHILYENENSNRNLYGIFYFCNKVI
jgi:hypothetical protein